MKEIADIVEGYEAAQERERLAERQRRDEEMTRRRLVAGRLAAFLEGTVKPVFVEAERYLLSRGHQCQVETRRQADPALGDGVERTVGLALMARPGGVVQYFDTFLEVRGRFDEETATWSVKQARAAVPETGRPLPLSQIDRAAVTTELRGYLAMALPQGEGA
jgi:hypothetical protein